jgi:hypothetical protein
MDLITFECANCRQVLKVGADKAGKKAKCPRCATPLQVPTVDGGSSAPPAPRPGSASPPVRRIEDEVIEAQFVEDRPPVRGTPRRPQDDNEEYEVIRPRKPANRGNGRYDEDEEDEDRPRKRSRSREEDYEDEDDDRPRKRSRSREDDDEEDNRPRRKRSREEDYDEDEDDDRPRRKRSRDDDYEDERDDRKSRRKRARSRPRGVGMLAVASLLAFIAGCIIAGACLPQAVTYIMLTIALFKEGPNLAGAFEVFFKITEILVLAYAVTAIVSYSFNMTVPNRRGSIGFSIATLVVGAAYAILYFIFIFLPIFGHGGGWGGFMGGPGSGSAFGAWFLLLTVELLFATPFILSSLFLRQVALSVNDRHVAGQSLTVVFLAGAYAVERILTYIMFYVMTGSKTPSGAKTMAWITMILVWIGFGIFIAMIIAYIKLFFQGQALED